MAQDPPSPSGQSLPPGTRLEEFVVGSVLGSGGFGITYLARDVSLGHKVVIKENLPAMCAFRDPGSGMVRPRSATGEDADSFAWSMRNFLREADTLSSLDHPGIVKVLRKFEANGTAYFVMPFEEGTALDVQVDDRKESGIHFTGEELRGLLWYMLGALEHLHERGIYHRDIKPGNILITHEGVPVLIDFGSARQRLSERSMTVVESPGYTPFEQLQSRGNVGPWSDIYALGATLAKAITHETPLKAMDRMRNDPFLPLATRPELTGRYSQAFLAGIDRALVVEPQDRWQDARQWREGVWGGAQPATQVPQPAGRASRLVVPDPVSQASQVSLQMPAATSRPASLRESLASNRKVQLIAGSVLAVVLLVMVLLVVSPSNNEQELARIAAEEQQAEEELPARKKTPIPGEGSKDAGQPPPATRPATPEVRPQPVAKPNPLSDFEWEAQNGKITISKFVGKGSKVVIPASIEGKTVVSIGNNAFYNCKGLTSVTMGDGVTSIGNSAFLECGNLASITIPDTVTSIGNRAFFECGSLANITIPDSVTSIGEFAFHKCKSLTSITIPDSVTSIGTHAFSSCTNLRGITIPDGVTSIGVGSFWDCRALTSISIPDSVTSIGDKAFFICTGLTSLTIGEGVTSIGEGVFAGCNDLTSITIPDRVTSIGSLAFESCTSLTSITIPDSVTSIGDRAFLRCTSLTAVTFLGDAPRVGSNVFGYRNLFKVPPTIYRKPEAKGWGDTWGGRPVKLISGKADQSTNAFEIVEGNFSWHEAKADAEARGGRLAVLATQEKINVVNNYLHSTGSWPLLWIGLSDEASEGDWRWINGDPLGANNWRGGEPNGTGGGVDSDYVFILDSNHPQSARGKWNDAPGHNAPPGPRSYLLETGFKSNLNDGFEIPEEGDANNFLTDGLVAHYPFNGNAQDESGNGNDGEVKGATLTTDRHGKQSSAYSFDGKDDFIEVDDDPSLNFDSEMTIAFWISPDSLLGARRGNSGIVGKLGVDGIGDRDGYLIYHGSDDGKRDSTVMKKLRLRYHYPGMSSVHSPPVPSESDAKIKEWNHWIVICDKDKVEWYLNGKLDKAYEGLAKAGDMSTPTPLYIGRAQHWDLWAKSFGRFNYFDGAIDDIRIYKRALSALEIRSIYDSEKPGSNDLKPSSLIPDGPKKFKDGLVAYYPFNGNAVDASGNGNDGEVNGATRTTDRHGNPSSAYSFDGKDDFIDAPDISLPEGNNPRTIAFWVNHEGHHGEHLVNYGTAAPSKAFGVIIHASGNLAGYKHYGETVFKTILPKHIWKHITMTYQDGKVTLYIDGMSAETGLMNPDTALSNLRIGNPPTGAWPMCYFKGKIDEVRIYNRALTALEVRSIYDSEKPGARVMQVEKEAAVKKSLELYVPGEKFTANFFDLVDRDLLSSAAEEGDPRAQFILGRLHASHVGLLYNEARAVEWYRKAADQGYADAQLSLARMYNAGRGVARDDKEAVKWYHKAADQGYADAQWSLGLKYRFGYGVTKDDEEAVKWYRKAAEQNYVYAQNSLGVMYQSGYGVTKDDEEAVKWYRLAAERNYALAQLNLGVMYQKGRGVPRDTAEAVKWYRKAAAQGNADAKAALHRLGYEKETVKTDRFDF